MKTLSIFNAETIILALQDEIHRSQEARYDHRLHAILLVVQGESCRKVAKLLGDSPRIGQYWAKRFKEDGFAGLADADRPGSPKKLTDQQIEQIASEIRGSPHDVGLSTNIWDGKTLSAFIKQQFQVDYGIRQCQRLFRQLGFRLRKPRPIIAKADMEKQSAYKKTSGDGR